MPILGITPSNFGKAQRHWVGIVEARNDPLGKGRVKIRISGYHSDDKSLLPTERLPWAVVVMPANNAAVSGVGQSPNGLMEGSLCLGIFLDDDMQMPAVLGTLNTFEATNNTTNNPNQILNPNTNTINNGPLNIPASDTPTGTGPNWYQIAQKEIGVKEGPGANGNAKILEYIATTGLSTKNVVAWCASFVSWCMKQAGKPIPPGAAGSQNWKNYGTPVTTPTIGTIIVLGISKGYGHIGFYAGATGDKVNLLGGNQSDQVKYSYFSKSRIVAMRNPP